MQLETLELPIKMKDMGALVGIAGVTAAVGAFVGIAGAAVKATFDWADELDHLQDVTGVTNKQAAALNFVLRKSGVSTDTLAKGMTILEKGLVKTDGSLDTIGKSLFDYGINVKDANGKVKDQSELIDEISAKYQSFGTQQERINFLTDVFGRSGANLVDFFDTLASEGGIDAVTQKVEAFGLAIDPARYEQFNRNLNELKLIATGLAVQLTERLMPGLEGVLGFFSQLAGKSPNELLKFLELKLADLPAEFEDWAKKVDWGKVSQDIITGIKSIDWANAGHEVNVGFGHMFSGLGTIIRGMDWKGIFFAAIHAFLDFLAGLTNQGNWDNVKRTWQANGEHLIQIETQLLNMGLQKISQILEAIRQKFSDIWESIKNRVIDEVNQIIDAINSIPLVPDIPNLGGGSSNRRASGGAVIPGQTYAVAEFNKPEVFVPNRAGRIIGANALTPTVSLEIDYGRLANAFVTALQTTGLVG